MSTRKILCEFHDQGDLVEATSRCEQCAAMLCVEHIFKKRETRIDEADNVYELCPNCYHQVIAQQKAFSEKLFGADGKNVGKFALGFFGVPLLIFVGFVIVMIVVISSVVSNMGFP